MLLLWIIFVFVFCVSHPFASVHCCIVVTCWDLALVADVFLYFCNFPYEESWVRCGAWLYRFLIFAAFLTSQSSRWGKERLLSVHLPYDAVGWSAVRDCVFLVMSTYCIIYNFVLCVSFSSQSSRWGKEAGFFTLILSQLGSEIAQCTKIDKPLVVYWLSGNVM